MLWIYAGLDLIKCDAVAREQLPDAFIDLSKVRSIDIAGHMETVYNHHTTGHVYLGFLDPLIMLNPQHEAVIRKVFRKLNVSLVVSNPLILPFAWKNGTEKLIVIDE
jgi:hypothetical protein